MKKEKVLAWYFSTEERKLQHGDNREIILGETHSVKGEIKLCKKGLHASIRLIDALKYAPGPILYRVEMSGKIIHDRDKIVASHRKYLWEVDATQILREFARKQALINIEKIKPYVSTDDYNLVVEFLKTGREDIREKVYSIAQSAAWASQAGAYSTARSAASLSARSVYLAASNLAAYSSAESATYSALQAAVKAAVYSALQAADPAGSKASIVWSKTYEKALSKANKMLTEMIMSLEWE